MKGLFGITKLKDKLQAQKFSFIVTIHNLQPWPDTGNRSVAIGWQRGKEKRGATRSVYPSPQPGKVGNVARFNEKFELSATLYKSSSGTVNANQMGPFKKKCLILAILEMDGRTQATAVLGRVVIDLAEFAAHDKQEVRFFMVTCNRQIHAAVGDPQLLITIRASLKKVSDAMRAGGDGDFRDDGSAMSADTTGSRMTDNLSTFLRHKVTGRGPVAPGVENEQDLSGFSRTYQNEFGKSSVKAARENDKAMNAIRESDDDESENPFTRRVGEAPKARVPVPVPVPVPVGAKAPYGSEGMNGNGDMSLRQQYGAGARDLGRVSPLGQNGSSLGVLEESHSSGVPTPVGTQPRTTGQGIAVGGSNSAAVEGANNELLNVAATEITVHMARSVAASSKRLDRAAHAAARRFVRTLVCLGPQQAPVFGLHVLRLISAQVDCSLTDLGTLAFWWSNLAHMRALLYQCKANLTMPSGVCDSLLPQVGVLERQVFDYVVQYLWEGVLLPTVTEAAPIATRASAATTANKRTQQEASLKRWFEGLKMVNQKLSTLVAFTTVGRQRTPVPGHTPHLRQQALLQCLKRVDALLFYHLVNQPNNTSQDLMHDYDPTHAIWGSPGTPPPNLEDQSLPFTRGLLSFGSGMGVKMTVTRLQQWATTEGGIQDSTIAGQGGASLFPLLKAAADLLMMPKELLMEPTIRRDTSQALSVRTMQHILGAFQPDEYAMDAISSEILKTLQEDEARYGGQRPALTDLSAGYRPPLEEYLLQKVSQGVEPSVEYDADSEDELVGFSSMAAPTGGGARFRLLHDLWYKGARFQEAGSIASSSRLGSMY